MPLEWTVKLVTTTVGSFLFMSGCMLRLKPAEQTGPQSSIWTGRGDYDGKNGLPTLDSQEPLNWYNAWDYFTIQGHRFKHWCASNSPIDLEAAEKFLVFDGSRSSLIRALGEVVAAVIFVKIARFLMRRWSAAKSGSIAQSKCSPEPQEQPLEPAADNGSSWSGDGHVSNYVHQQVAAEIHGHPTEDSPVSRDTGIFGVHQTQARYLMIPSEKTTDLHASGDKYLIGSTVQESYKMRQSGGDENQNHFQVVPSQAESPVAKKTVAASICDDCVGYLSDTAMKASQQASVCVPGSSSDDVDTDCSRESRKQRRVAKAINFVLQHTGNPDSRVSLKELQKNSRIVTDYLNKADKAKKLCTSCTDQIQMIGQQISPQQQANVIIRPLETADGDGEDLSDVNSSQTSAISAHNYSRRHQLVSQRLMWSTQAIKEDIDHRIHQIRNREKNVVKTEKPEQGKLEKKKSNTQSKDSLENQADNYSVSYQNSSHHISHRVSRKGDSEPGGKKWGAEKSSTRTPGIEEEPEPSVQHSDTQHQLPSSEGSVGKADTRVAAAAQRGATSLSNRRKTSNPRLAPVTEEQNAAKKKASATKMGATYYRHRPITELPSTVEIPVKHRSNRSGGSGSGVSRLPVARQDTARVRARVQGAARKEK